jgi:hypothetical protein
MEFARVFRMFFTPSKNRTQRKFIMWTNENLQTAFPPEKQQLSGS